MKRLFIPILGIAAVVTGLAAGMLAGALAAPAATLDPGHVAAGGSPTIAAPTASPTPVPHPLADARPDTNALAHARPDTGPRARLP